MSLKPKTHEDIYLPCRSGAEGAYFIQTSYSNHYQTITLTEIPIFQGVTQLNMSAIKWGHSPSYQPDVPSSLLREERYLSSHTLGLG